MTAWDTSHPPELDLIKDCVHCGFCLPTCPSYAVFEDEADSPRGRILLMRIGHEEGATISEEMVTHFDRCLGCMACVTACPSGVQYDKLIERTRPQLERSDARSRSERAYRRAIFALFTHPGRLRALVPGSKLAPRLAPLMPHPRLKALLALAPPVSPAATFRRLPASKATKAPVNRGRVAFMQGCIQRVFFGDVNAATLRVLSAEGWDVDAPRSPRCCGALQMHSGVEDEALGLARETIAAYESYDAVVANVAGCGSAMKDYGHLLADDPEWGERAAAFSAKVVDVHELLGGPRAAGRPPPDRAARRLPRRLPPRARAGDPVPAARAAARDPRAGAARARRMGAVLRVGRDLQPAPAGRGGEARRAQGREPARDRRRGDRRRQPGLRAADRPRTWTSRSTTR